MSMFTRCPHCDTVFRVTPQQLQVSSGQVRCGRCQEVFDAFATLTSRLPGGRLGEPADGVERPVALPRREPEELPPAIDVPPFEVPSADVPAVDVPQVEVPAAVPLAEAPVTREPAAPPTTRSVVAGSPPPAAAAVPEPEALTLPPELFGTAEAPGRTWTWVLACAAALLALVMQAAWFFPSEIALRAPRLRPLLVQYCALAGCRVELPRVPDLLFIEASDLQLLDPARPNEVLLTATLRNRAGFEQALPLLELTLTDSANRTAARKVFRPAEYLGPDLVPGAGIGAGQEVSLQLYLDTGEVKAAGYRLYLFFA